MTPTILVIIGERNWTRRALHLAAAMAREAGTSIIVTRMVRVEHLEYLGAAENETFLPYDEFDALEEYIATTQSYGVPAAVELFEYTDYSNGLRSAADQHAAVAVFAPPPTAIFDTLARWRLWLLRRLLRRPLYTLAPGDEPLAWTEALPDAPPAPAPQPSVSARNL